MKEKVTIAYRCPDCGVAMIGEISIFALSGGEVKMRCSCGESLLTVNYIKSRDTVALDVPCVACPTSHPYQVAASTFWSSDIFILQCSASGLDTCFIGEKENVIKAVEENTRELQKLMSILDERDLEDSDFEDDDLVFGNNYGDDNPDFGNGEADRNLNPNNEKYDTHEYADALVTSQMLYILKELNDTEVIRCNCEKGDYLIDVGFDTIEVSCDKCGAKRLLRSRTDNDIIELAGVEELRLQ